MKPAAFTHVKIVCFAALCFLLRVADSALGQPLSGSGTATVNGTLDSGEWSNAGTVDLTVALPPGEGGGTTTGRLYVMNDSSTLYFAVKVDRNLKNAVSVWVTMEFDNDNDGGKEVGDDRLQVGFSPGNPPAMTDQIRVSDSTVVADSSNGGTNDISAASQLDGTYSFMEFSHPLNSADDSNDFSLTSGLIVGFKLWLQIWSNGAAEIWYPAPATQLAQIQISGGGAGPLTERFCFPQFGVGGGMTSQIVLTNPSQQDTVTAEVHINDNQGAPVTIAFNGLAGNSVTIPPLGSVTLKPINPGQLTVGSAGVLSSGELGGTIRFEITGVGIAGVGSSLPVTSFIVPVRRTAGAMNTGVAVQSLGPMPTRLEFYLRTESGQLVPDGFAVIQSFPPWGHLAQFIDELFSNAQLDSFTGTLVVRSFDAPVAAAALELGAKPGEFTTLPVVALTE